MESLEMISKLLNERIMLGQKEEITENLSIIPVYKIKINFMNVNADIKKTIGDGTSGGLSITPLCILQIKNENISVISLEQSPGKEDFFEWIPNLISNVHLSDALKCFK